MRACQNVSTGSGPHHPTAENTYNAHPLAGDRKRIRRAPFLRMQPGRARILLVAAVGGLFGPARPLRVERLVVAAVAAVAVVAAVARQTVPVGLRCRGHGGTIPPDANELGERAARIWVGLAWASLTGSGELQVTEALEKRARPGAAAASAAAVRRRMELNFIVGVLSGGVAGV